jgi:4-hydroxy-tetrahydrodipicolinate synthase
MGRADKVPDGDTMDTARIRGVWLPVVTPFREGQVDLVSYGRLIDRAIESGVAGIVPLGTTGESPTVEEDEFDRIVEETVGRVSGRVPVFVGVGGNHTAKVAKQARRLERFRAEGILSVCPYYNRPDQRGIYEHFRAVSEATPLSIIVYNIPYRTGRNIENATLRRLAELKNVVGVKDSCGDPGQTADLLLNPPPGFAVLTGEDALFYSTLALGGHGGILAASHVATAEFVAVYESMKANDHLGALARWRRLAAFIPLLFREPNPAPIKHYLWKKGLIASREVRLPLVAPSAELAAQLEAIPF